MVGLGELFVKPPRFASMLQLFRMHGVAKADVYEKTCLDVHCSGRIGSGPVRWATEQR